MKTLLEVSGKIQWWLYTVSHGQLLLRRPKRGPVRRLDIFFKDVGEVHLPRYFDDLRIIEEDGETALALLGQRRYTLLGGNAAGHIIAGALLWVEDDREYDEPSSLTDAVVHLSARPP